MSFNAEPPVKSQPASAQATQMPSLSLSSPTMKLDLVAHFPPQTLKIQELISVPGLFSDSGSTLSAWVAFSDSLCEEEPVSFEAQEEVEPWLSRSTPLQTSENIFAFWKLRTSQVLVCTGYGETERAAPSANAGSVRVFLVTGKLGRSPPTTLSAEPDLLSAKSTFSARLLMRWFALKLLTTLRVKGGYAILLREGCASRFPRLGVVVAYERLGFQFNYRGRIWAFVDSNRSLVEPAPLSRHANPFLVARPVSPQPKRFGWVKNVNIETWYVEPRSFTLWRSHRSRFLSTVAHS